MPRTLQLLAVRAVLCSHCRGDSAEAIAAALASAAGRAPEAGLDPALVHAVASAGVTPKAPPPLTSLALTYH
jgi:hypothetical protein